MAERKKQEADQDSPPQMVARGDGNADEPYVGVDPIYQNHASDTEAPLTAEGDAGKLEEQAREREVAARKAAEETVQAEPPGPDETRSSTEQKRSSARDQAAKSSE